MKYFVDAKERIASGHENYIEFQPPRATKEFWDESSLYMSESTMLETGFYEFWTKCMSDDIIFDMDTISRNDILQMLIEAKQCGGVILEVVNELIAWIRVQLKETDDFISINRVYNSGAAQRKFQKNQTSKKTRRK